MGWADGDELRVVDEVLSKVLDGEAVLLDLGSGTYFGLNEVGTAVWEVLTSGATVGQIRDRIVEDFEVEADVATRDLHELLDELETRGLVRKGSA